MRNRSIETHREAGPDELFATDSEFLRTAREIADYLELEGWSVPELRNELSRRAWEEQSPGETPA